MLMKRCWSFQLFSSSSSIIFHIFSSLSLLMPFSSSSSLPPRAFQLAAAAAERCPRDAIRYRRWGFLRLQASIVSPYWADFQRFHFSLFSISMIEASTLAEIFTPAFRRQLPLFGYATAPFAFNRSFLFFADYAARSRRISIASFIAAFSFGSFRKAVEGAFRLKLLLASARAPAFFAASFLRFQLFFGHYGFEGQMAAAEAFQASDPASEAAGFVRPAAGHYASAEYAFGFQRIEAPLSAFLTDIFAFTLLHFHFFDIFFIDAFSSSSLSSSLFFEFTPFHCHWYFVFSLHIFLRFFQHCAAFQPGQEQLIPAEPGWARLSPGWYFGQQRRWAGWARWLAEACQIAPDV